MIQKVSSFLKKDTVLTIALALAVLSMFIIPPSAGYLKYLDLHTLILLFGLMTATTGLQNIGFFRQLGELLLLRIHSLRQLEQLLILLCFFPSMLITNDVALITFVPFALELLRMVNRKDRIVPVVVCQTANRQNADKQDWKRQKTGYGAKAQEKHSQTAEKAAFRKGLIGGCISTGCI